MTTQATHTSGPWAALMQNPPTVSDRRGCRIATACQLPGDSVEEQQSNARLIAAAPDLLASLRVIAADGKRDGWIPSYHYGEAQKAIAKAEGRAGE